VTNTPKKTIAVFGALALSTATIAACGGGDEVSADEYVGSICSAVSGLTTTIIDGQTALQEAAAGDISPEDGKEQLQSFFDDATSAADTAASDISDAGTPDVENGEEISETITTAFEDLSTALGDASDDVEALPTDSEEDFQSGAEELGTSFQEQASAIGEGVNDLGDAPELESAAEDNSECQSLESGISAPSGTTGTS
jgi:hypothetical protein